MNKKIKISLLGVLLTSSLAGITTTISSCSASATPELTIEQNPNLITELDKALTEYLANLPSDSDKSMEFDSWLKNGELPQNAKNVISQNVVFKNGSKVVPFNDVFEKFVVSNKSGFPGNPILPIPAIDIEIKIKEGPFVISSSSTSLLKFKTGELGYLNPIPITDIVFKADPVEIKKTITTELNKLMDVAITYQDKFNLYTQWTQGINIPTTINALFYDTVQFQTSNDNTLTWNQVFDKFEITATSAYPSGSNAPLPNMTLTTKLLGNCTIDQAELDKHFKFLDIPFTSNTGKIRLDVAFKDPKNPALVEQLSSDISVATTYQERKVIFNAWDNTAGAMKPGSISQAAKDSIFSNLILSTFGYNNPLTLDDFVSKISIVPVDAGNVYPNDLIANLPQMKLVLTWNRDNFSILEGADELTIQLPPLTANSGVGEFDVTISKTLEKDMTNLFTNELNNNIATNKTMYESWNTYNSLPTAVKNALVAGISFDSTIDIPNVNTFENIIDTEKTQIIKEPFPNVDTVQIKPIQIKLVLKPGRFVKNGGSLASELPIINVSNLPNAEALVYIFDKSAGLDNFVNIVRDTIKNAPTFEDKKNFYNQWNDFVNFPTEAIAQIDKVTVRGSNGVEVPFITILESKTIYKGSFPSVAGESIPNITLEFKLNRASKMGNHPTMGPFFKIIPITINFKDILS